MCIVKWCVSEERRVSKCELSKHVSEQVMEGQREREGEEEEEETTPTFGCSQGRPLKKKYCLSVVLRP